MLLAFCLLCAQVRTLIMLMMRSVQSMLFSLLKAAAVIVKIIQLLLTLNLVSISCAAVNMNNQLLPVMIVRAVEIDTQWVMCMMTMVT